MRSLDDFLWAYEGLIHAVGINSLLALSIYLVLAVGQLSMGQAAFMGIGAYSGALLTLKLGVPFPLALLGSAVVPAVVALLIGSPTIRLTGVYLAISTIALGEILRVVLNNLEFTGSALGLSGIPHRTETWMIYSTLAIVLFCLFRLGRTSLGRAMEALREDEVAAAVAGINLPKFKLFTLTASAALAGLAGAFSAHSASFVGPNEYGFEAAVSILSFALLGGIVTPLGPVLGAAILTMLPEALRGLADWRLVINGLIIVIAVLFLPRGLLPLRLRRSPKP